MQERLYDMGWTELRPIQVEAIHAVFDTPDHLVIAARTASGKTEAAFLPILSLLAPDSGGSIRAIYLGPLRALINDQFPPAGGPLQAGGDCRAEVAWRRGSGGTAGGAAIALRRAADHAGVDRIVTDQSSPGPFPPLCPVAVRGHR